MHSNFLSPANSIENHPTLSASRSQHVDMNRLTGALNSASEPVPASPVNDSVSELVNPVSEQHDNLFKNSTINPDPPSYESIQPAYEEGGVPVFKPSYDEFRDFYRYITAIESYGMKSGIVKIIPPEEWHRNLPPLDETRLNSITIRSAIKQVIEGVHGVYTQMNMSARKRVNIKQWKELCESDRYRTPTIRHESAMASYEQSQKRSRTEREMDSHDTLEEDNDFDDDKEENNKESTADISVCKRDEMLPRTTFDTTRTYLLELEKQYWKHITFLPPIYGADIPGSLFDSSVTEWNVAKLDNLLSSVDVNIPGVNKPYLYFGMWKATFAWHLEDMDLYSINYLHYGAPKQWYSISQQNRKRFEQFAKSQFPSDSKICPEFLRHKTYHFSPARLSKEGIPVNRCVQEQGEFMITFPYGYHAGFNYGYNCAESINFAVKNWIDIGKNANCCCCVSHSVKIDVAAYFDSGKENGIRDVKPERPKLFKMKPRKCVLCGQEGPDLLDVVSDVEVLAPLQEANKTEVAENCSPDLASQVSDGIKKDAFSFEKKYVHLMCAQYVPETVLIDDGGKLFVNLDAIPRARKALKCCYCSYKKGACIQCVKGKCVRAFHPTCAYKNDLLMRERLVDVGGSAEIVFESFCSAHDPRKAEERIRHSQKHIDMISQYISDRRKTMDSLKLWAKWSDSKYYPGFLEEDYSERRACRILFTDGYVKIVSYNDVSIEKPPNSIEDWVLG